MSDRSTSNSDSSLSEQNRAFVNGLFEKEFEHWNEVSASLLKWLFATLITINLGGMAFTITLGIHPEARSAAGNWFFAAMTLAMVAALCEVFRIWRMKEFFISINTETEFEGHQYSDRDFHRTFRSWYFPAFSAGLCAISLFFFFRAGIDLRDATRMCSSQELEMGKQLGDNVVPVRNDLRHCYFYKIDGLPDDPLERAIFEQNLMKKLRDK